jgi:uncharacterized protein (TIGR00369 family)
MNAQAATPNAVHFGLVPMNELGAMDGLTFFQAMMAGELPAPPFSQTAGIKMVSAESGAVAFEGIPSEAFYNPLGTVHGGWTAMILDTVMACAVHSTLKAGQVYTSIEIKVNFDRPISASTGPVRAEGKVINVGGRIGTSEGRLLDSRGRLLAHGTTTCLVLDVPANQSERGVTDRLSRSA